MYAGTLSGMSAAEAGPPVASALVATKPHATTAAWYLWRAVDLHKAGKLPAPLQKTRIKIVKKNAATKMARKKVVAKKRATVARKK